VACRARADTSGESHAPASSRSRAEVSSPLVRLRSCRSHDSAVACPVEAACAAAYRNRAAASAGRLDAKAVHASARYCSGPRKQGYATIDRVTGEIYGSALAKRSREPRPPLDWDGIGAILQALIEGFGLRYKIDPAVPLSSAEPAFDLYALAVSAVLAVPTRPVGDDADTGASISGLLNA
jgi:hypothetical protein